MIIRGVDIEDTFAEAFDMSATRVIITATDAVWAGHAARTMTGFATSVIACGVEAGIEGELDPLQTPDGRPGISVLLFAMSAKALAKQLETRVGQCVLTCPGTAAFAGIEGENKLALGRNLRFFGDGFQISKMLGGHRYWRIPVMDGEFLCQEYTAATKAVGGGNFLVLADTQATALAACAAAVQAIAPLPNVILPFPGGVVRSGSKVGSKYRSLPASTNDAYCPTLRGLTATRLTADVGCVLEIVIDGLTPEDVRTATRAGIQAACRQGRDNGVIRISAGNYGGKLGPYHFHLREILA